MQQQQSGGGPQLPAEMDGTQPQVLVDPTQPPLPHQLAETPSPISSLPPHPPPAETNFDELGSAVAGAVGFPDDEEAERGGPSGSRWPRQETLALLKIRSEMDAAFREATFKGPLWEETSRKLAELGYKRNPKKCKEKFENVHKYYKRTKEGRAGRQDGKTYRFFTQLEALHGGCGGGDATAPTAIAAPPLTAAPPIPFSFTTSSLSAPPAATRIQPFPVSAATPPPVSTPTRLAPELGIPPRISSSAAIATSAAGISFSSNSLSSSTSDSDSDEEMEEYGGNTKARKRKRTGSGSARRQMMAFLEGLMKQVMERQEAMQQRFLEAIEKREQERTKREEAWLLQEVARLRRQQELLVQERAMAASRDTAVISYLQKITGQPLPPVSSLIPVSSLPLHSPPPPAPPPPANPPQPPPYMLKHEAKRPTQVVTDFLRTQASPATQLTPISSVPQETPGPVSGGFEQGASSSRWPKAEVHELIKLRSGLESRYQEAGQKGPLWEEISAAMQRLGYNRNPKRCKEKWENINKYFKKVKESNKKRSEDSKTCPYFVQLDVLYRRKQVGNATGSSSIGAQSHDPEQEPFNTNPSTSQTAEEQSPRLPQEQGKDEETNGGNSDTGRAVHIPTSNGGHTPSLMEEGLMNKPEDIVTELIMEQRRHRELADVDYDKMDDETDSENTDQDDDKDHDDDSDDEDSKQQYRIRFQRPTGGNGTMATAAAKPSSFLAMVQ